MNDRILKWLATPTKELQLELEMPDRTGYTNPQEEGTPEDDDSFEYKVNIVASGAGLFLTIYRDGRAYASIACDSVQEAEWFRERIPGRRPRD